MIRRLHKSSSANAWLYFGLFLLSLVLIAYLTGYLYLWHIKAVPFKATPLTALKYWIFYSDIEAVRRALLNCAMVSAVIVWSVLLFCIRANGPGLFGDAAFATMADIKAAGLLGKKGLLIGYVRTGLFGLGRTFLRLGGQLGIILAAPPRSGKGASFVNANNLDWEDSVVTLDVRKESYRVTSGYRKKIGSAVYLWDPLDERGATCQINPLFYVSDNPNLRINDLQKNAHMLFPDDGKDMFWMPSCRTLFLGIALFLFETPGAPRTLGEVLRTAVRKEAETYAEHWGKLLEARGHGTAAPLSDACIQALAEFAGTPEKTAGNIIKSFAAKMELWNNPLIDTATSGNSLDLRNLRKKKISLYFGILPGDLERLLVLNNMMFQLILDLNTREMPEDNPELKYQLFLNMDEFTSLGKIPIVPRAASYLGGYGIRLGIVIQSPSQLRSVYGNDDAETIMACMGAQIAFAPREQRVAEDLSRALGKFTTEAHSVSKNIGFGGGHDPRAMGSRSTSKHGRDLLDPTEIKRLGKLNQLIFLEDVDPIRTKKIRYFADSYFKKRLLPPVKQKAVAIVRPNANYWRASVGDVQVAEGFNILTIDDDPDGKLQEEFMQLTAQHVEVLDTLDLRDLDVDFDKIEIPGDPMSAEEMNKVVSGFLETMQG